MSELSIQLFGKFTIQSDGHRVNGVDSKRIQELLAYLLVYRDRPHRRESLAELLWQASSTTQSKKYLRQTLWQMQQLLPMARLIHAEPDWIRISPAAPYWLDVAELESAFSQAEGVSGQQLSEAVATRLDRAVALYRGDLLEGWYSDWCLFERERLQNMWLAMLDKLMSYCETTRQYEAGVAYGMRVLRADRAREQTHRRLMRMAYLAGDRTGALRLYERCVQALQEELDVRPSRRTEELRQQILHDAIEVSRTEEEHQLPLVTVSNRLGQLQTILTQLHMHIGQDLDALDHALADPD